MIRRAGQRTASGDDRVFQFKRPYANFQISHAHPAF
jgi:hypothetical protein